MAGSKAAAPAAGGSDATTLAKRLAGEGLDRGGVIDAMTGLGYTKAQSATAADSAGMPATITPAGGADPSAATPPAGAGSTPPGKGARQPRAGARSGGIGAKAKAGGLDVGRPSLRFPSKLDAGDASGFAFGLLLYVLALQFIKYGPSGPTAWLRAKFLNQPQAPAKGTGKPKGDKAGDGQADGREQTPSDYRTGHRRRHQHDDTQGGTPV
jgi:hypothetical protein